jgi:hypothetical protein
MIPERRIGHKRGLLKLPNALKRLKNRQFIHSFAAGGAGLAAKLAIPLQDEVISCAAIWIGSLDSGSGRVHHPAPP